MKILCIYCDNKKCNCGGARKITKQPEKGKSGDVEVKCSGCGHHWLHYHQRENRQTIRGTARLM